MKSNSTEAQEYVTVDSFAQLPFIRPAPSLPEKQPPSSPGLRLFGFEVPQESPATASPEDGQELKKLNNNSITTESGRKFECHYCCRNFPTSQALGGHQNAHKRERQHAKRIHLQSAMSAAHSYHGGHRGSVYGLLQYPHHHLSSAQYPSWQFTNNNYNSSSLTPSVYGGIGTAARPINGNPLPGQWRAPNGLHGGLDLMVVRRDGDGNGVCIHPQQQRQVVSNFRMPLPLLGDVGGMREGVGGYTSPSSSTTTSSRSSQSPVVCDPVPELKENVSLDLHL